MDRGAAAKVGGMDRQTLRDWVHRFNALGPEGLIDNWTQGPKPRLSAEQLARGGADRRGWSGSREGRRRALAADRPQARHRRAVRVEFHERYVGKLLKSLGFSHISARPRHPAQDERIVEAFKNFPRALKAHVEGLPETTPVEIWFEMLCSRGLCQTGKAPDLEPERSHVVECLSSDHLSRYRTELVLLGPCVSVCPKTTRLASSSGSGRRRRVACFHRRPRHWLDPQNDAPTLVVSCFEAGRDGFWLHRLLTAHGVINHVVEPTSISPEAPAALKPTGWTLSGSFASQPQSLPAIPAPAGPWSCRPWTRKTRSGRIGSGNSWCRSACASKIASPRCSPPRALEPSLRSWDAT